MNLYFLVEGRRTEKKLYPAWLSHLVPELTQVWFVEDAVKSNYFLISGEGYPSLLDVHLANSIKDYNETGKYDRLVVCLDIDDSTVAERSEVVTQRAVSFGFPIEQLTVISQECCIETWFLGNRRAVSPAPNLSELNRHIGFYNVRKDDPELMTMPKGFTARSVFHHRYFQLVAQDKGMRYSKQYPRHVIDRPYLDELVARRTESGHMATFGAFIDFCAEVRRQLDG